VEDTLDLDPDGQKIFELRCLRAALVLPAAVRVRSGSSDRLQSLVTADAVSARRSVETADVSNEPIRTQEQLEQFEALRKPSG
jgi:hypothetical protein